MDQPDPLPQFPFERPDEGPPREYELLRKRGTLQKVQLPTGQTAWLATRYQDVRDLLADNRLSVDPRKEGYPQLSASRAVAASTEGVLPITHTDQPDHTRLRRALTREFTVARVQALQAMIEDVIYGLIDQLLTREPGVDLISEFALPVPTTVILKMLGISYAEHEFFQERANQIITKDLPREVSMRAQADMRGRVLEIIQEKESDPDVHDDIIGRLIKNQIRTDNISYEEACGLCQSLIIAGHETTANMIGLGTLNMLRDPKLFEQLRNGSMEFVGQVVEEMLRYWTTVNYVGLRVAVEDVEFGDVTIKAGEGVLAQIVAANYDPAVYENPDKFDIDRDLRQPHLAFGFGIHQCIGQQLARMELKAVFNHLPKRIPTLRLAASADELEFNHGFLALSLRSLPVAW